MDKTLEITLKAGIKTNLPTCDEKEVFTNDDVAYRKHKYDTLGRKLVGERLWKRWFSYDLCQWI